MRRRKAGGKYLGEVVIRGRTCKLYAVESVTADQWSYQMTGPYGNHHLTQLARCIASMSPRWFPDFDQYGRRVARTKRRNGMLIRVVPQ